MNMQMSGQYYVDTTLREGFHRNPCPANNSILAFGISTFERVMRDDHARDVGRQVPQPLFDGLKLPDIDSTIFDGHRSRSVDAGDSDFCVGIKGFKVWVDIAFVPRQRRHGSRQDIPERNVVIARHDDLRARQEVQERPRLQKFNSACALCQIPRHNDQIWTKITYLGRDGLDDLILSRPKMKVGKVNQCLHFIAFARCPT